MHLQSDLRGCDFSELTVWQADLRQVNLSEVNFQNANLAKSVFTENLSSVVSVSFNPDGSLLATGDVDGKICLWRVVDGQQVLTLKGHTGWIWAVTFSPDGKTLASCSHDSLIRLWDVQTIDFEQSNPASLAEASDSSHLPGTCLKTLRGHFSRVWTIAFSPDGQLLASGSDDQTIRLWNAHDGTCLTVLQGLRVGSLQFALVPMDRFWRVPAKSLRSGCGVLITEPTSKPCKDIPVGLGQLPSARMVKLSPAVVTIAPFDCGM